tara:strand:+ start:381 stop:575 length:195 start_codon:yes stop_codon:yes gene_type:complete
MSADTEHAIDWVATRKTDGEIEYLISGTPTWGPDGRFAKVFDTKSEGRKFLKNCGEKGTVRKHK